MAKLSPTMESGQMVRRLVKVGDNGQEGTGGRVRSSPLARKIAAAAEVELGAIHGSGPGGRVTRRDVEAFLEGRNVKSAAASSPATAPAALATATSQASAPPRVSSP